MPNLLVAGNSTNGGTAISTDTSGTLNIVTGSGSGVTAMSIDASGNVSGVLKSGTAVASTSGTSIDFTGIPSTAKRITVMFNGVSTNGISPLRIQIGSGSVETSGYTGSAGTRAAEDYNSAAFLLSRGVASGATQSCIATICTLGNNIWAISGTLSANTGDAPSFFSGNKTTSGVLDRLRITTTNGTDTFDAGSINILFE